jgi:hypothetical protein
VKTPKLIGNICIAFTKLSRIEAVCSTSGTLAPAPVPAEGWAVEAEGLAGSGAGGGVVA